MTAQERLELGQLRTEIQAGFQEIRGLHMDLIQRVSKLEASASAEKTTADGLRSDSQFMLMKFSVALSLVVSVINFIQNH